MHSAALIVPCAKHDEGQDTVSLFDTARRHASSAGPCSLREINRPPNRVASNMYFETYVFVPIQRPLKRFKRLVYIVTTETFHASYCTDHDQLCVDLESNDNSVKL
jgi:hypothetical protein